MNIESFRTYCLSLKGVEEGMPFGDETLVFKVMEKLFALTNIDTFTSVNLKCDPEKAIELREQYPAIIPGYHMNKKHWNTLVMDGSLSDPMIKELTKDSYDLVVASLTKKSRQELEEIE
ncbi:MAG TPA: MmcQ/YjbR family DNA-binding protein [Cytophagaceae bacterium]|jgi:predicted DNA-binding protein (MmcQ/YjbR family)|nr:MmcQ/YjbR family DNA-binding protein [Cytophagaceae bacterium]